MLFRSRGKHQLSGRYFYTLFKQPPQIQKVNILALDSSGNHVRVQNFAINHSYSVSPTLLFNTWFGWNLQTGGSLSGAPFSFPDAGVNVAYLRREWHNTLNKVKTLDCHRDACNVCGMQNLPAEQCAVKIDELTQSRRAAKASGSYIPVTVLS